MVKKPISKIKKALKKKYAEKHQEYLNRFQSLIDLSVTRLPSNRDARLCRRFINLYSVASGKALNAYMLSLPNLVGGSADVASSVMTKLEGGVNFGPEARHGHNVNWGIREFGMASAQNGMLFAWWSKNLCWLFPRFR